VTGELKPEQRERLLRVIRDELDRWVSQALADGVPPERVEAVLADRLRSVRELGSFTDDPTHHSHDAADDAGIGDGR
jgi:hypothetical protein